MKSLDTLYGRKLKGIKKSKDGTWRIMLDGDVIIANHDTKLRTPDIPKDMYGKIHFAVQIIQEERTQLVFKDERYLQEWRIVLNPTMYSIKIPGEEEVFPQRGVLAAPSVPPHPDERIAEGPSKEIDEGYE